MPELNFSREVQSNLLTIRESEANEAEYHIHVLYYNRVTRGRKWRLKALWGDFVGQKVW